MTDSSAPPHQRKMLGVAAGGAGGSRAAPDGARLDRAKPDPAARSDVTAIPFETLYDTYFPYIWRSVQRLGVPASQVDDVVQEVFLVVHRRLSDFEGRSTVKTWLYGVALRVARVHRARYRRAQPEEMDVDRAPAPEAAQPDERAANAEAARIVSAILDDLDDDQREVFVLAELEQLPAPEIAKALDVKLNTVYSRLRLARAAFAEGAARLRARDRWRTA